MRISNRIQRGHIVAALKSIQAGQAKVPARRDSTKYDLLFEGKRYPPKFVICLSHKGVDGTEWPNKFHGGSEANNFLIARGFEIVDKKGQQISLEAEDENEESTFPEGRSSYRLHRRLERDSRIAKLAKRKRFNEAGVLACDVCGFSFSRMYGSIGIAYIEAHHTVPVSQLKGTRNTKLNEIALVCSNCHRMLHASRPWLSIKELRELLSQEYGILQKAHARP